VAGAALFCLGVGWWWLPANPSWSIALALPLAAIVILIGESRWLHMPLLDRIGDLSYGLYLWAFPVQQLVFQTLGGGTTTNIAISLPVTVLLATLSWHFVEKAALRLKPLASDRPAGPPPDDRIRNARLRSINIASPNTYRSWRRSFVASIVNMTRYVSDHIGSNRSSIWHNRPILSQFHNFISCSESGYVVRSITVVVRPIYSVDSLSKMYRSCGPVATSTCCKSALMWRFRCRTTSESECHR
jgi:hypothetical protein